MFEPELEPLELLEPEAPLLALLPVLAPLEEDPELLLEEEPELLAPLEEEEPELEEPEPLVDEPPFWLGTGHWQVPALAVPFFTAAAQGQGVLGFFVRWC